MKTREELQEVHVKLHRSLDELLACFIESTNKLPSTTTLLEFLEWSANMRADPVCVERHT